ncbi:MAG: DUF3311 domain-containing protein [Firmicutes bacterium]|nr:DUF3311 domain-containing protein [Bacillota bacterium]
MRALQILCAAIPVLAFVVAIPWVNRVTPMVLGLPFLLFWIALWVILTPGWMALVYYFDPQRRKTKGGQE